MVDLIGHCAVILFILYMYQQTTPAKLLYQNLHSVFVIVFTERGRASLTHWGHTIPSNGIYMCCIGHYCHITTHSLSHHWCFRCHKTLHSYFSAEESLFTKDDGNIGRSSKITICHS